MTTKIKKLIIQVKYEDNLSWIDVRFPTEKLDSLKVIKMAKHFKTSFPDYRYRVVERKITYKDKPLYEV